MNYIKYIIKFCMNCKYKSNGVKVCCKGKDVMGYDMDIIIDDYHIKRCIDNDLYEQR